MEARAFQSVDDSHHIKEYQFEKFYLHLRELVTECGKMIPQRAAFFSTSTGLDEMRSRFKSFSYAVQSLEKAMEKERLQPKICREIPPKLYNAMNTAQNNVLTLNVKLNEVNDVFDCEKKRLEDEMAIQEDKLIAHQEKIVNHEEGTSWTEEEEQQLEDYEKQIGTWLIESDRISDHIAQSGHVFFAHQGKEHTQELVNLIHLNRNIGTMHAKLWFLRTKKEQTSNAEHRHAVLVAKIDDTKSRIQLLTVKYAMDKAELAQQFSDAKERYFAAKNEIEAEKASYTNALSHLLMYAFMRAYYYFVKLADEIKKQQEHPALVGKHNLGIFLLSIENGVTKLRDMLKVLKCLDANSIAGEELFKIFEAFSESEKNEFLSLDSMPSETLFYKFFNIKMKVNSTVTPTIETEVRMNKRR